MTSLSDFDDLGFCWRSGGSWRAAGKERVWVGEGSGLGTADAEVVISLQL